MTPAGDDVKQQSSSGQSGVYCFDCGSLMGSKAQECLECGKQIENELYSGGSEVSLSSRLQETGLHRTAVSGNWWYLIVGGIGSYISVYILFLIGFKPGNDLIRIIFGVAWLWVPVGAYFDIQHVRENTEWDPDAKVWVASSAVWFLGSVVGVMYLHRRYEALNESYGDYVKNIEDLNQSIDSLEAGIANQKFQKGLEASKTQLRKIDHMRTERPSFDDGEFNLDELEARFYSVKLSCIFQLANSALDEANSAAESDRLAEAVRISKKAKMMAESAVKRKTTGDGHNRFIAYESVTELSSLHSKVKELWKDAYKDWLVYRINFASEATQNISAARGELDEIFHILSTDKFTSARVRDVIREAAESAYVTLLAREGQQRLFEGNQQMQEKSYEQSVNAFKIGHQLVREAIEYDAVNGEHTNLLELQNELADNYWEATAVRGEYLLKMGQDQYKAEEFEAARNTFREILEEIDYARNSGITEDSKTRLPDIRATAADNMDTASRAALGIRSETRSLRTPSRENTKQTRSEQKANKRTALDRDLFTPNSGLGPPTAIPGVERQSVSYNEITQNGRIGRGGDADVYDATIQSNGESIQVALKQPREQGTIHSGQVGRFTTEAETWSKLDEHDYIVGVVDWGDTPLPWILLEKMDGGNLATSMDDFSFEQSIWTAQCVSEAVAHAHSRGIAHLDLKPANILFRTTGTDSWPVPKVGDWGLSRPMLDEERDSGGLTPEYAAPEQIDSSRFGAPDQSTDIYQLGAVFYHLLTNRTPHVGDDASQLAKIVDDPVVPPSEVNTSLPPAVDEVLLKGLARHKEDRYESVLYFRDRLTALADRDPVDQ